MKAVGYYDHDIDLVEEDLTLFSGVANPFHFVKIKPHENVLDVGCGVGVDTLIAAQYTDGLVYGLDPCENEVLLAREIAKEKKCDPTRVKFCQSGIKDGLQALKGKQFEVIISNGSYCLFEGKKDMFGLLYETLAPEGRLVLCKTVLKSESLAEDLEIPGLEKLIHLDSLKPLLEGAGFKNVVIDMSSSKMKFDVEYDRPGREGKTRSTVQLGPEAFTNPDLGFTSVNDVLARVTIMADK